MPPPLAVGCYLPQTVAPHLVFAWARAAEAAGLQGVWLPEHLHQFPDRGAGRLEAWTVLGALAAETHRIRLGLGVCNTQLWNPALLAKMAFTLDRVSAGRFDLALGTGGNAAEMRAYGMPPRTHNGARQRLRDAILTVRALEGGGPACTPPGSDAPLHDAYCFPTPRQQPFPLAIAGDHPDTLRLVAQHADCWYANLATVDAFAARNARLTTVAEAEHRDPRTLHRSAHVSAILGTTPAAARRAADAYAAGPRARRFASPHLVGDHVAIAEGLAAYRAAGADRVALYLLNLPECDEREGVEVLAALGEAAGAPTR